MYYVTGNHEIWTGEVYTSDQGWFPEYAGGMYSHGELTHIVCRGVYIDARMPRIFNPPEIAVIDFRGTG